MMADHTKQYMGRKAKRGSIMAVGNTMGVFVDYCPDCKHKLLMPFDEANLFAQRWVRGKRKLHNRAVLWMFTRVQV